ncbi:MAG TPA: NAD(P)/FAD-dependent oxidoreductase [Geminicoccaceae bacterium]|nr:NAD(P)/FAD-dependent oxidoreductase [Geminicoccaceae bacterium]
MSAAAPGTASPHHIVVVGGGAGGLVLATRLGDRLGRRGKARITLVDCALTHVWKPLLHEIAAGTLHAAADGLDYLVHAARHHFTFELGRMRGLDRHAREILLDPVHDAAGAEIVPAQRLGYDTLVFAVGSVLNDFGVPGVAEHCLYLDSLAQAERIQQRVLREFLRGHSAARTATWPRLQVAIVGAGATGVEFAAELRHAGRQLVSYRLRGFDPDRSLAVRLIEAAPTVLPALPARLQEATARQLAALSIEVHTGEQVREVSADGIQTQSGAFFPADLIVWTAGVKGPSWLADLDGLETDRLGRLVVDRALKVTLDDAIFALGDCAACPQPDSGQPGCERTVPPRAQAAHQQARTLAGSLERRLEGKPLLPFRYKDYGSLISLSSGTIGNLMGRLLTGITIEGRLARLAYLSLYQKHQSALHGLGWVTLRALGNLLQRRTRPQLKLH